MKLARYLLNERPSFGAVVGEEIVDLAGLGYADPASLLTDPEGSRKAQSQIDSAAQAQRIALSGVALLAPLRRPGKIMCVGLNYRAHVQEGGRQPPAQPVIFAKWPTCIADPNQLIVLPADSEAVDYEAELAVVIGKGGRNIPVSEAAAHIAGYTAANDITARDIQRNEGGQWTRGKSFDGFAPMGPWIVTPDALGDPQDLAISLTYNDDVVQESSTSRMIFGVFELVAFLSRDVSLETGDVILTGTPEGVGYYRNPRLVMRPGDVVSVRIENIGVLTNSFAGAR